MKWVYYIPTTPFKSDFMMFMYEIIRNIDLYRVQQQGYGHPLTIIMSKKIRKEAKPHEENPPSRKDMRGKKNVELLLILIQIEF